MASPVPRLRAAALAAGLALAAGPVVGQPVLQVIDAASGQEIARLAAPEDGEWCLTWAHSVTGGAVADCFALRGGRFLLTRSFLHDVAAGLGDLPGRGQMRAAEGGGYWIEHIDEALPAGGLRLRIGPQHVGHALTSPAGSLALSGIAAGRRVILRPAPGS
jgi:hypothetical protein